MAFFSHICNYSIFTTWMINFKNSIFHMELFNQLSVRAVTSSTPLLKAIINPTYDIDIQHHNIRQVEG